MCGFVARDSGQNQTDVGELQDRSIPQRQFLHPATPGTAQMCNWLQLCQMCLQPSVWCVCMCVCFIIFPLFFKHSFNYFDDAG